MRPIYGLNPTKGFTDMIFIKTRIEGLLFVKPNFGGCEELDNAFDSAVATFDFLLQAGHTYTGKQFAEEIKGVYCIENPKTKLAYDLLSCLDDLEFVYRYRSGSGISIAGIPDDLYDKVVSQSKSAMSPGELLPLDSLLQRLT
jgi:hypothetical protein